MEAFNSRFKTENRSLLPDTQTLNELQLLVSERMEYYNNDQSHSSMEYQVPAVFVASLCHGQVLILL